ncbi:MAG: hypothetical protein JW832_11350 [Deltaproteobacteria bacterium]|nr:hypothetical protein [Deltaproteobacteria bacterium]
MTGPGCTGPEAGFDKGLLPALFFLFERILSLRPINEKLTLLMIPTTFACMAAFYYFSQLFFFGAPQAGQVIKKSVQWPAWPGPVVLRVLFLFASSGVSVYFSGIKFLTMNTNPLCIDTGRQYESCGI